MCRQRLHLYTQKKTGHVHVNVTCALWVAQIKKVLPNIQTVMSHVCPKLTPALLIPPYSKEEGTFRLKAETALNPHPLPQHPQPPFGKGSFNPRRLGMLMQLLNGGGMLGQVKIENRRKSMKINDEFKLPFAHGGWG